MGGRLLEGCQVCGADVLDATLCDPCWGSVEQMTLAEAELTAAKWWEGFGLSVRGFVQDARRREVERLSQLASAHTFHLSSCAGDESCSCSVGKSLDALDRLAQMAMEGLGDG